MYLWYELIIDKWHRCRFTICMWQFSIWTEIYSHFHFHSFVLARLRVANIFVSYQFAYMWNIWTIWELRREWLYVCIQTRSQLYRVLLTVDMSKIVNFLHKCKILSHVSFYTSSLLQLSSKYLTTHEDIINNRDMIFFSKLFYCIEQLIYI